VGTYPIEDITGVLCFHGITVLKLTSVFNVRRIDTVTVLEIRVTVNLTSEERSDTLGSRVNICYDTHCPIP
jgi:hypothetical protein